MKRLFSLLTAFALAAALCAPVMADDVTTPDVTDPTPTPTAAIDTTSSDGVYVSAYSVTDTAGGEVTTVQVGDKINIVLKVVDHASARYCVKPEEISARINSAVFTYTGTGEIGQLFDSNDDPNATRLQNVRNGSASPEEVAANAQYNYYSYVILFRDVIYNGGGNTLPINLSYLDTAKPLQQFSVTLGQCVDKDQTTSPNLLVRTSSYGDSVTAGQAFDLSLGLYATDGNENLDDVIVSLTLPENISLNGGSLSSYLGTICPKQTRDVTFQVMPASGFTGTVADNIRFGKLDATQEEIERAARIANAHSFIRRLPDGYDTMVTADGANLSQGQRQLLAIARAAVADPPVLILDEATSSVDTRTEELIEKGMDRLMENRTVFVIAHRLSTVRNSKAILVLEKGTIIERGDHEELLGQKGRYYQLYTGQFELE